MAKKVVAKKAAKKKSRAKNPKAPPLLLPPTLQEAAATEEPQHDYADLVRRAATAVEDMGDVGNQWIVKNLREITDFKNSGSISTLQHAQVELRRSSNATYNAIGDELAVAIAALGV